MTTCLILAAGEAERHNGGNKPLLEVNGETLLNRTIRLLVRNTDWSVQNSNKQAIYCVTHRTDLDHKGAAKFEPNKRRWITETLLSTVPLWRNGARTQIFLGDVYYTESAVRKVFQTCGPTAFGKGCNIHALAWCCDASAKIRDALTVFVENTEHYPRIHGAGKLWLFVERNQIPLIDFGDETTDFDSPQEHKRFIAKYGNRNR